MTIEKKDWEQIKKESENTIKNAEIVIAVNTALLREAEIQINRIAYAKSSMEQSNK